MDYNDYNLIPEHMMISLKEYCDNGRPVGHFLTAIFSNDLRGAVSRADDTNLPLIPTYVCWVHMNAPNGCYGSYEKVNNWKGMRGVKDEI